MVLCPAQTPSRQLSGSAFTDGGNNRPGAKSWLKFGCAGYGLGQGSNGGCDNNAGFLQDEIGHEMVGRPPLETASAAALQWDCQEART